jgi:hypothetical protein
MQINPGAVLNYACQTTDTITQNPQDVISAVGQILRYQGLSIQNSRVVAPGLVQQTEILIVQSFSIPFTAYLAVQTSPTGPAYGSEDDVRSIIDNAFYQVVSQLPASSSIPSIASNPGQDSGATGEATPGGIGGDSSASASSSIGDSVSAFFNNLSAGSSFALIAVIVVIAIIIVLAVSPGSAAGVVRSFR